VPLGCLQFLMEKTQLFQPLLKSIKLIAKFVTCLEYSTLPFSLGNIHVDFWHENLHKQVRAISDF
jgi:hypothetical protein